MSLDHATAWVARHPVVPDLFLLAGVVPLLLVSARLAAPMFGGAAPALIWVLVMGVSIAARQRWPEAVAVVIAVAHVVHVLVLGRTVLPSMVLVPLALYGVALGSPLQRSRWWLLGGVASAVFAGWWFTVLPEGGVSSWLQWWITSGGIVGATAVVVAGWFMGRLRRVQSATDRALRERADALARERDQAVRAAAAQERIRIARDMHDIVAHSLAVIIVQSNGARYAVETGRPGSCTPPSVSEALSVISSTARRALTDTRQLVSALREGGEPEHTSTPDLSAIPSLVQGAGQARHIDYIVVGDPQSHPEVTQAGQLAAYRVIQESLTNVLKHAGDAASIKIRLEHGPRGLTITVTDDGHGRPAKGSDGAPGNGLLGLQERVTTLGGLFEAGNRREGGFNVRAEIPAGGESSD